MKSLTIHRGVFRLPGLCLLSVLFLSMAGAGAAAPVAAPEAVCRETAARQCCTSPAAAGATHEHVVLGALLGDRQRMVPVALVFMVLASPILSRGNRL